MKGHNSKGATNVRAQNALGECHHNEQLKDAQEYLNLVRWNPGVQRKRTPQYRLGPKCLQQQSVRERAQKEPAQRDRGGWRFVTIEARRSEARCAVHTGRVGQAAETVAWGADHDFPMLCRHTFSPDALWPPPKLRRTKLGFLRQPPLRVFRNAYNFLMLLRLSNSISVPASELHISTYAASELVIKFTSPGWATF